MINLLVSRDIDSLRIQALISKLALNYHQVILIVFMFYGLIITYSKDKVNVMQILGCLRFNHTKKSLFAQNQIIKCAVKWDLFY